MAKGRKDGLNEKINYGSFSQVGGHRANGQQDPAATKRNKSSRAAAAKQINRDKGLGKMTFEGQVFLWVVIGVPLLAFMVYREVHPKK